MQNTGGKEPSLPMFGSIRFRMAPTKRNCSVRFKFFAGTEKVKVRTLATAPVRSESPPQKRSRMARVV